MHPKCKHEITTEHEESEGNIATLHLSFITASEFQSTQGCSFEKHFWMCIRTYTKADKEPADWGCTLGDAGVRRTQRTTLCQIPCVREVACCR